jgi:hypothetical protein
MATTPPSAGIARRVILGARPLLSWPRLSGFPFRLLGQELADRRRDFLGMGFKGEVPGVEELHHRIGIVAPESFRAWRQEERSNLPKQVPHYGK